MNISIVIPALNSPVIGQTLASLEKQVFNQGTFRIIVVGRDDYHQVGENERVHFDLAERPLSPAEARNRGASQTQDEVIVFLDSDCIAPPCWLETLVNPLENPKYAGVGGGVNFVANNYWTLADNLAIFHEFLYTRPAGIRSQLPSLNCAVRRSIFEQVKGFDERYPKPAGEDFDLFYRISRLGGLLFFEPKAWIQHAPPRTTLRDLILHAVTLGKYSTKLNPDYPEELRIPGFLRNKWTLRLLSAILAAGATARVFSHRDSWRYFYTLPAVFCSKMGWCFGAAESQWLA